LSVQSLYGRCTQCSTHNDGQRDLGLWIHDAFLSVGCLGQSDRIRTRLAPQDRNHDDGVSIVVRLILGPREV
jgi:hypothetical protein